MCICPLQMNVSLYILYNRALYLSTCQHNALEADLKIITGFCKTEFGVMRPPILSGINSLTPLNSA